MKHAGAIVLSAMLAATVPLNAQQGRGRASAWRDIQGFNIVLVVGESQRSSSSNDEVPSGARKALNDMREFLPYKHYRVLDSQWTSCCSPELVRVGMPIAGRLQGVTAGTRGSSTVLVPGSYAFNLSVSEASDGSRIPVRFSLRLDDGGGLRAGQAQAATIDRARENRAADLRAEMETLNLQIQNMQARVEVGAANALELRQLRDRHAQLERRLAETAGGVSGYGSGGSGFGAAAGPRSIIDSSFTMEVGETVVVGTSRLGGDKALIALVTAVRRSTSAR